MSVTSTTIIPAQYAPSSATTLYTSPSATNTIIDRFTAQNNSGGSLNLTVYLVPLGQSPSASNLILNAQAVGNGATVDFSTYLQHTLAPGYFISCFASAGSGIVVMASGRLCT